MESDADGSIADVDGITPAIVAAEHGHFNVVREILRGNDEHATEATNNGRTLLHAVAAAGDADMTRTLLAAGADPSARQTDGVTPLDLAVSSGSVAVMHLLLEAGADTTCKTSTGRTVLHRAARMRADMVATLIEAGADVNARDSKGRTPLHDAVLAGSASVAQTLLEAGAQADAMDTHGETPLFFAVQLRVCKDRHVAMLLLQAGADPLAFNGGMQSPLDTAVKLGDYSGLVWHMLSVLPVGTDLDEVYKGTGSTPLRVASLRCDRGTVTALLAYGSSVDSVVAGVVPVRPKDMRPGIAELFDRHRTTPFTVGELGRPFSPLLTKRRLWKIDHVVAYWATRDWRSGARRRSPDGGAAAAVGATTGAVGSAAASLANVTMVVASISGASASAGSDGAGGGSGAGAGGGGGGSAESADSSVRSDVAVPASDTLRSGDNELEPQPYNVGLPEKIVFWQSMPRNVVARVIELSTPLV